MRLAADHSMEFRENAVPCKRKGVHFMITKKASGFYVGVVAALLCVASAVMYGTKVSKMQYKEPIFNSTVCVLLAAAAVIGLAMLLINKLAGFAPVILCAGSGIGLLMAARKIIWPIADTIYGIEPFAQINELLLCVGLMAASFVVSEIALYLKKTKTVTAKTTAA